MASKIPTDLQWADLASRIKAAANVQSDWNESDSEDDAYIKNKPNLAAVATSGSYSDLTGTPSLATVATSGDYGDLINTPTIPTVNNATITIQKNSVKVDDFTANQATAKTINITVPTTAADVSALPASTKYGATLSMTIDDEYKAVSNPTGNPKSQGWYERSGTSPNYTYTLTNDTSVQSGKTYYTGPTYVITSILKDQDGNTLGSSQTVDLPLESVVVSGYYDSQTKKVVLTLKDGSTIEFSVADLVSGLQTEITSSNKLSADLVDDSTTTNKFVTASDKTTWSGKQDKLVAGSNIQIAADGKTISATDTTYNDFSGATSGAVGVHGLVPAPASGETTKFLKSDGTWGTPDGKTYTAGANIQINGTVISATDTTYSAFTGADGSSAGTSGLVPAPSATDNTKFLKGDGTWANATYTLPAATTSTLGGVIVGDGLNVVTTSGATKGTISVNTFTTNEWDALWA